VAIRQGRGPRRRIAAGSAGAALPLALAALATACATAELRLPAPVSVPAATGAGALGGTEGRLAAGVGRADITPPVGVALALYGPDGGVARGWRGRLAARALAIRDRRGETIVLATADLGVIPLVLHREVASRVSAMTEVGADRILLAATHTHAGPGNIFSWRTYNEHAAGLKGYDPELVAFLADGIAGAILEALGSLRPARVGWTQAPVWGVTRNRSLPAYRANREDDRIRADLRPRPPPGLDPAQAAVDPTWTLVRVDTLGSSGSWAPAGTWSAFAVHGTGNPPANDLLDSDVQGIVETELEARLGSGEDLPETAPVHAVALAASGDVTLAELHLAACEPAAARRPVRPAGPRSPPPLDVWESPSEAAGSPCQALRRADTRETGRRLATTAADLHAAAGSALRDDLLVARAFRTVPLRGPDAPPGLCPEPELGTPTGGGSEDGANVLRDWKILGLFPTGTEEGTRDERRTDCQAPKKRPPALLEAAVSPIVLPDVAQLMVVGIGDLLVGALPAEPTTTVGLRVRSALLRAAEAEGLPARGAVLVGLANGYMQYLATPEEYATQNYEGSSTLYGPESAPAFETQLVELVRTLPTGGEAAVAPVSIRPGATARRMAAPETPPAGARFVETYCSGDTAVARWRDGGPGAVRPADGPVVTVRRGGTHGHTIEDGDPDLEVRHLGPLGGAYHLWEARYTPADAAPVGETFRFRLPRRPAVPAEEVRCP